MTESPKLEMLGLLDMKGLDSIRRVYDPDGIAPTLTTCGGGVIDKCKFYTKRGTGLEN